MKSFLQLPKRPLLRMLLLLAGSWAVAFLGPFSYLVIPAVLVALWRARRQRTRVALPLLIFLNPVSGFFIAGVATYLNGAPILHFRHLPDLESYNPNPSDRCPRSPASCQVNSSDWLTIHTPNAAVLFMSRCFGPPALAYNGPYPTKAEALALMPKTLLSPVDQFLKGRVLADGKMVRLQPAVVRALAGLVGLENDDITPIHARLYQSRCLILRFSRRTDPSAIAENFDTDVLVLVDRSNQRPFAYYQIAGASLPQSPPATYLE